MSNECKSNHIHKSNIDQCDETMSCLSESTVYDDLCCGHVKNRSACIACIRYLEIQNTKLIKDNEYMNKKINAMKMIITKLVKKIKNDESSDHCHTNGNSNYTLESDQEKFKNTEHDI